MKSDTCREKCTVKVTVSKSCDLVFAAEFHRQPMEFIQQWCHMVSLLTLLLHVLLLNLSLHPFHSSVPSSNAVSSVPPPDIASSIPCSSDAVPLVLSSDAVPSVLSSDAVFLVPFLMLSFHSLLPSLSLQFFFFFLSHTVSLVPWSFCPILSLLVVSSLL